MQGLTSTPNTCSGNVVPSQKRNSRLPYVKFEILTSVVMKSFIFWYIKPCSPFKEDWRLWGILFPWLAYSSTLKTEATCLSKTTVDFQLTTRRNVPEDRTLQYKPFLFIQFSFTFEPVKLWNQTWRKYQSNIILVRYATSMSTRYHPFKYTLNCAGFFNLSLYINTLCQYLFLYFPLWFSIFYSSTDGRPPLWSSGQSSWLQIRRPGFDSRHYQKKSNGSGRGSTQPREYNWGATW
jgi:hypothetical protein